MRQETKINKIGIVFHRFGPYHICRINALNEAISTVAYELSSVTKEYKWNKITDKQNFKRITLFTDTDSRDASIKELKYRINEKLNAENPDLMLINGWGDKGGLLTLKWCLKNKKATILMTDETEVTNPRFWLKEYIKKKVVQLFDAALVAGKPQIKYVIRLGINPEMVATGYDVVDNNYFAKITEAVKQNPAFFYKKYNLPHNYFIVSSRFIEKKNLFRVIEAYEEYVRHSAPNHWKLLIVGDGDLKTAIDGMIIEKDLQNDIIMPGFLQYDELPYYYALAKGIIHASTSEQWGLVINEAMACGLPVILSDKCGCSEDLVINGRNGYTFDPYNVNELSERMILVAKDEDLRIEMGRESERIISKFGPNDFANSVVKLVNNLTGIKVRYKSIWGQLLLNLIVYSSSVK